MLREYMDDVIFLEKKKVEDPAGGFYNEFVEGATFKAIFQRQSTQQQLLAQQQGLKEVYVMIILRSDKIAFNPNDYVKHKGKSYRIVSNALEPYEQSKEFPVDQYQLEIVEV